MIRLLLGASILALSVSAGQAAPAPTPEAVEARAILKELVEINTTHAHGSTAAAEAIRARLLAAGYPAPDVALLAPDDKPTKGNLVVRVHGRNPALKPVGVIAHLDVVEAKREDWSMDPFVLTEKDGYFYGRGTEDIKDGDSAMVEALLRIKRSGWVPARDLIFAFTADEEAGGDANGPAWLLKTHRNLVDAGLILNLDGGGGVLRDGKPYRYSYDTSEKVYVTYRIEATSPGGHGSLPGPDNAIYRIADGLHRLSAYRFPVMITPTTRASFAARAALAKGEAAADLAAVAQTPPDPAAAERLSDRSPFENAQLRTTCVATLISGGHAENALPQRAAATIQCRMIPSDTAENVRAELVKALADPKIAVTLDVAPIAAPDSPLDPAVTTKIEAVAHSLWPGVPVAPGMATGFSDDRQFRNAGIPCYNVGGLFEDDGENRAHGRDERIRIDSFDQSVEYTWRLVKAFGG